MTAIVYRQLPDIPHRQYVRRIVAGYWLLWHRDKAMALVFERDEAKRLADVLWMRSRPVPHRSGMQPQPSRRANTALRRCYRDLHASATTRQSAVMLPDRQRTQAGVQVRPRVCAAVGVQGGEPMKAISLGWGVQSFTLAAMAALGELDPVDVAIHADTYRTCKDRQATAIEEQEPETKTHYRDAWGASSCGVGHLTTANPARVTCRRCLAYHIASGVPIGVLRFLR